jgi:hypothetical protein
MTELSFQSKRRVTRNRFEFGAGACLNGRSLSHFQSVLSETHATFAASVTPGAARRAVIPASCFALRWDRFSGSILRFPPISSDFLRMSTGPVRPIEPPIFINGKAKRPSRLRRGGIAYCKERRFASPPCDSIGRWFRPSCRFGRPFVLPNSLLDKSSLVCYNHTGRWSREGTKLQCEWKQLSRRTGRFDN